MGNGNANGSYLVAGPRPGLLRDVRTGEYIEAKNVRDQIFFDTEQIVTPVPAGTSYFFFRDLNFPAGARKGAIFTNMVTSGSFPSGWHTEIRKIGFRVLYMEDAGVLPTSADMMRVLAEGSMQLVKANQRTEAEGRIDTFPSPNGFNMFSNDAIAPGISMVNNGVPSAAAVPDMNYSIVIENLITFTLEVEFPRGVILDGDVFLLCELHTTLTQPIL